MPITGVSLDGTPQLALSRLPAWVSLPALCQKYEAQLTTLPRQGEGGGSCSWTLQKWGGGTHQLLMCVGLRGRRAGVEVESVSTPHEDI